MKKLLSLLKYTAIGLGALMMLVSVIDASDPLADRFGCGAAGLVIISCALFPFVRNLLFSLASLFLAYICFYSLASNEGEAKVMMLLFAAVFLAIGLYNGYRAFQIVRGSPLSGQLFRKLRNLPKANAPIEPTIHATQSVPVAQPTKDPAPFRPTTCEDIVALKPPLYNPADVPTAKPDLLDSYAKYGGTDAEMLTVDLMEGHDFEYWCANALQDLGFENVEVTPGSGDQGVDILAEKDGLSYAIQCKRYNADLGNTPVQEVHSGKYFYRCHVAAVITNRYFTPGAKDLAAATGVLLWDRDWILRYLQAKQNPDGSILISHAPVSPPPIGAELDVDEMLPAAIDLVLEAGQASVSMLQRRLQCGYARAARLVDEMEELGFVGPYQGSSPRQILITRAEWEAMRSGDL